MTSTSSTHNSILNLPSGDYIKYYSQIPKYILENSNNCKDHRELVDFCNNQSVENEFYNMKNVSSNQYYAYPKSDSETESSVNYEQPVRVTTIIEVKESKFNGHIYNFILGDPVSVTFFDNNNKIDSEPIIVGNLAYLVFSPNFFQNCDYEIDEIITFV